MDTITLPGRSEETPARAWLGDDHILGVTTNGPLAAAHRFGYVGGPVGPAKWKLGTLTIGTAGGSDPFKDAGLPLGDPKGKGSRPWGQFAYGYLTGASGGGTKAGQGWADGLGPSLGWAAQRASVSALASPNASSWTTRQPGEALPLRSCEPRRAGCE
jgi:hypothetical protein